MLTDYYRTLRREVPQAKYSRKSSNITVQAMYILSVRKRKYGVSAIFKNRSLKNLA